MRFRNWSRTTWSVITFYEPKKSNGIYYLKLLKNKSTYVCALLESTSGNPFPLIQLEFSSCTVDVILLSLAISSVFTKSATDSTLAPSLWSDGEVLIWMFFAAHNFRKRMKSFIFSNDTSTIVVTSVRFSIWKWCEIVNSNEVFFLALNNTHIPEVQYLWIFLHSSRRTSFDQYQRYHQHPAEPWKFSFQ